MIKLLAEHRVAANLAMIMMLLAGVWAVKSVPSQLDPPVNFPTIRINVDWRGASAEDMEKLVTLPIEQNLRNLTGMNEVYSRSTNGHTYIAATFHFDTDMTLALDHLKQRVANVRNLPASIERPEIDRDEDEELIAVLTVTGPGTLDELTPIVRDMEKDLLDRGIERIWFSGLPAQEIALLVSGKQLQELGLTLDEIANQVDLTNQNVPAGSIGRGQGTHQLRSLDQQRKVMGFEQLTIETGDQVVRFDSFGTAERRPRDGQPIVERNGQPAIQMVLFRATKNDAYLAELVLQEWLTEVRPGLPPGVEVIVLANIWDMLGSQLDLILTNGISGLFLVVGILFLFLSGRVGWWVMVGIPVSFLLGLALFHGWFGHGISIIALIGFIMAVGIVVDDAIVVGEDVVTHFEMGMTPADAAIAGAKRMWVPVVTSSLTTMAAFVPLLMMGGPMGDVILILPTVMLCIIAASLIECFCVLPGHLRHALSKMPVQKEDSFRSRFNKRFLAFRDNKFMPLAQRALDYPGTTIASACGAMIIAISLLASQHVSINMNTGFSTETLEINIEYSAQATVTQKDAFLGHLEQTLETVHEQNAGKNITGWVTVRNQAEFNSERKTGIQYASLEAEYAFEEQRNIDPEVFATQWRTQVNIPVFVEQFALEVSGGSGNGQPDITFVLSGEDLESLKSAAEELSNVLSTHPGVSNISDNLPYGKEQLIFSLTPTGRSLGLTSASLGRQLRAAYSGRRVQIFNENEVEIEVIVVLPDAERDSIAYLQQLPIETPGGEFVALSNIATLYSRRGIDTIRHIDSNMSVSISASVDSDLNNAISITESIESNSLDPILDKYNVKFGLGGRSIQDRMLMETMSLGGILTLVFIYLILAWVFASYLWPLAIMTAIPFGLSGAVFGHWFMDTEIGPMSMLAFFSLTGIVVNDSIVLISFLKRELEAGKEMYDALIIAIRSRFRAVLLTSVTTVAGLTPLLFEGSSLTMFTRPIAITICFGLTFATLLVLLVIPALLLVLENSKDRIVGFFKLKPGQQGLRNLVFAQATKISGTKSNDNTLSDSNNRNLS